MRGCLRNYYATKLYSLPGIILRWSLLPRHSRKVRRTLQKNNATAYSPRAWPAKRRSGPAVNGSCLQFWQGHKRSAAFMKNERYNTSDSIGYLSRFSYDPCRELVSRFPKRVELFLPWIFGALFKQKEHKKIDYITAPSIRLMVRGYAATNGSVLRTWVIQRIAALQWGRLFGDSFAIDISLLRSGVAANHL